MNKLYRELSSEDISFSITPEEIGEYINRPESLGIIGQPRALKALKIGTEIRGKGYNLFVTGLSGTGRYTAIRTMLKEYRPQKKELKDFVYVYNFRKPDNPRILYFQPGKAKVFKRDIHNLVERLKFQIKARLESDAYREQRDEIVSVIEQQENRALSNFEAQLSKDNFQIMKVQEGENQATDIIPIYNGKLMSFDEMQVFVSSGEITESEWHRIREKYYHYMDEMKKIFLELRETRSTMDEELNALRIDTI
ncbi:MAG: Lon-like protease helical domain-containing protein, partial [Spirochaetota bacterium]